MIAKFLSVSNQGDDVRFEVRSRTPYVFSFILSCIQGEKKTAPL